MTNRPEKKKVLVVEDEPHVATYLRTLLQDNGYETSSAANGLQGFEMARQEKPDLVILDLVMPGQTGTDLYMKLRRDDDLRHTPVIIVSAVAAEDLSITEPVAVFDKPIDPDAFLSAVERTLA